MSYLHCHSCNWSQDDFWSKDGYNPFRQDFIDWYKELLFKNTTKTDSGTLDTREFIACELEKKAKLIRDMNIKTYKEWESIKGDWICPKCASKNWDID